MVSDNWLDVAFENDPPPNRGVDCQTDGLSDFNPWDMADELKLEEAVALWLDLDPAASPYELSSKDPRFSSLCIILQRAIENGEIEARAERYDEDAVFFFVKRRNLAEWAAEKSAKTKYFPPFLVGWLSPETLYAARRDGELDYPWIVAMVEERKASTNEQTNVTPMPVRTPNQGLISLEGMSTIELSAFFVTEIGRRFWPEWTDNGDPFTPRATIKKWLKEEWPEVEDGRAEAICIAAQPRGFTGYNPKKVNRQSGGAA